MHRFFVAVAVSLFVSEWSAAADWYQFRGPSGQGFADSKNLPTEWSPEKNVAWRAPIAGLGWSSPVIVGGRVYLTTAVPNGEAKPGSKPDYSLRALCLDAKSGKPIWDKEVFKEEGAKAPNIHGKNSHASPTPIVEGDKVYVHFGHMGTACLNIKDGSRVWTQETLKYSPVHGNGGSPIIVEDHLIFSIDGSDKQMVVALNKKNGQVAWQTPRNAKPSKGFSFCTPLLVTVNGKEQLISNGSDVVMGLDPKTGHEIWRARYNGYSVVPRPVFGNGLLYICTGYDNPTLFAVRVDGKGDVTDTHIAWTINKNSMPRNSGPLLIDDTLYTVSDGGMVSCIDAKSGKIRWEENLGRPGSSFEEVATNKFTEPGATTKLLTLASYAVDGDALFLRTAKALYRIEKR